MRPLNGLVVAVLCSAFIATPAPGAAEETSTPPAFSAYREARGLVFVAGHVPVRSAQTEAGKEDVVGQTREVIARVRNTLRTAQLGLSDVVSVTVYLKTMADFDAFNKTYAQEFPQPYPARTTVAVGELAFDARVEMSCIAVRPATIQPAAAAQ